MALKVVENDNFVIKQSISFDGIAIGNLKAYGEGMYISEEQLDVLIETLQEFKKVSRDT